MTAQPSVRLARLALEPTEQAPGTARSAVRQALLPLGCPPRIGQMAELLASEVVTNAIKHCRGDLLLELTVRQRRLRVSVSDDCENPPRLQSGNAEELGGRGLVIVEALAEAWGWERSVYGKQVWFEVDVYDGATAPEAPAAGPAAVAGSDQMSGSR